MNKDAEESKHEELEKALYLFNKGEYYDSYYTFGNKREEDGVRFTVGHQMLKKLR